MGTPANVRNRNRETIKKILYYFIVALGNLVSITVNTKLQKTNNISGFSFLAKFAHKMVTKLLPFDSII